VDGLLEKGTNAPHCPDEKDEKKKPWHKDKIGGGHAELFVLKGKKYAGGGGGTCYRRHTYGTAREKKKDFSPCKKGGGGASQIISSLKKRKGGESVPSCSGLPSQAHKEVRF